METKTTGVQMTRKKIIGLIGLIIFAMIFIFACLSSVLPFGRMLVGVFGVMVYPFSLIFAFLSLAAFLGFSYRRNVKATTYFVIAILSVILVIHSISTFKELDAVVTTQTLKNYLNYAFTSSTVLGAVGSTICGLISMLLGGMGTIVVFVILTTLFVGLFIDWQLYGKYEAPHIKKLKSKKLREKVYNSDKNVSTNGTPAYSFSNETVDETSVDATEYEMNTQTESYSGAKYTDDDVVDEITDDYISENNSNSTTSNYFAGSFNSYQSANSTNFDEPQEKNEFSNNIYEETRYPDVYTPELDEHRRQFMNATFGKTEENNENLEQDFQTENQTSSFNPSIDDDSTNFVNMSGESFESINLGENQNQTAENISSYESKENSSINSNLDDEISKILSSNEEDDELEVKNDVFENQPNQTSKDNAVQSQIKNENYNNITKNYSDTTSYSGGYDNFDDSRNKGFADSGFKTNNLQENFSDQKQEQRVNNFNQMPRQNGFNQNGYSGFASGFNSQQNTPFQSPYNNGFNQTNNINSGFAQNLNSNSSQNSNVNTNKQSVVVPSKPPKNNYGMNIGMTGLRYNPPPLSLLRTPKADTGDYTEEQNRKSAKLENVLAAFNIPAKVKNIVRGPKITRYELALPLGVSVKKVPMFEDDIAAALAAKTIVIKAPIPGSQFVGIELENDTFTSVYERELLESDAFQNFKDPLPIAIGKDISGEIVVKSLAKMVHLLIAGSTGSGKSVFIHNIVLSLIYKSSPDDLRLIMIDPKKVEFNRYNGLPHLLTPEVVMGSDKAINALKWSVKEMERRYDLMSKAGYNNIEPYNKSELVKAGQFEKFPYIVIIVDELAEIMMVNKKEVEACIQRLTQLARACGMHLVLATQRPSVDIISGVIKNNIPSRIAFSLQSGIDSKTILNAVGAEKLLGQGDMIFAPTGTSSTPRLQAAYASDEEIKAVIDYDIKYNKANYDETVNEIINSEQTSADDASGSGGGDAIPVRDLDGYFKQAVKLVMQNDGASVSYLQRRLSIGYARAARIIDQMEDKGYIAPATGSKVRKVLITPEMFKEEFGEDFDSI